jgi:hypothetical protein
MCPYRLEICSLYVWVLWGTASGLLASDKSEIGPQASTACEIRYPGFDEEADHRHDFPLRVLKLIVANSKKVLGPCTLVEGPKATQKRTIELLKLGKVFDVAWLPAQRDLNENLLPIYVPIRKGLLGWRLLLIRKNSQGEFGKVNELRDLQKFATAYDPDWQDWPVMKKHFPNLIKATSYEGLFKMLHLGRVDFISRALHEAYVETKNRQENMPELEVENSLAIYYRQADFFYVSPSKKELYEKLTKGFKQIIRNGSFAKLFYETYASLIIKVNIPERTLFYLENPNLSKHTPLLDPELWFLLRDAKELRTQGKGG